jgi:quinoprotein glucose dehydrogenase/quinate dehydrogenase (quinone)
VLTLIGITLLAGGAQLALLGGSPYYVVIGGLCLATGVLSFRRHAAAASLYLIVLALTAVWSLAEVGTDFYQLLPRLGAPVVLGLLLALQGRDWRRWRPQLHSPAALRIGVTVIAVGLTLSWAASGPTLASGEVPQRAQVTDTSTDEWRAWGRTVQGTRYSPADQINLANVDRLQLAWDYDTGDSASLRPHQKASIADEQTPLKVGDTLYICTPHSMVAAIDADSGKQRWKFDPDTSGVDPQVIRCRGVAYHHSPKPLAQCTDRILFGTIDERLIALDAQTGQPCRDFGTNGQLSTASPKNSATGNRFPSSPAVIVGDVAVLGGYIVDNMSVGEPSGVVRAFNVYSGKLVWAWDSGAPDGAPLPNPGDDFQRGSPNAWAPLSADPELGLVYVPTGNAGPDFLNGHRRALDSRYASSVVALEAATGKVRWSFQTTHLDIWDYDVPAQPVLFNLPMSGGGVPAVAVPTKRGEIFVLDRKTGKPLTNVEERKVPRGNIPGENYSPTQPYSTGFPSLAPKRLKEADMWGMTPLDQLWCRIKFRSHEYSGDFTPPSLRGTIQNPGNFGALNWGSVSVDEARALMFANSSALPLVATLVPRSELEKPGSSEMHVGVAPQAGTPYGIRLDWMLSPLGIPCTAPPWGLLTAIDLQTKSIRWQRPLGTTSDHAPLGLSIPGVFNIGGSVSTRSGLLFIGATLDARIRAFDVNTGREVWLHRLPGGGQAGTMTYISKRTGRQYVVISAGGNAVMQTKLGSKVVAFALPKKED